MRLVTIILDEKTARWVAMATRLHGSCITRQVLQEQSHLPEQEHREDWLKRLGLALRMLRLSDKLCDAIGKVTT